MTAETWIDPALHVRGGRARGSGDRARRATAGPSVARRLTGVAQRSRRGASPVRTSVRRLAEAAASDPLALDDAEWVTLLEATGADLDALTATADDVRRYTVGEAVSLVVNRNLTSSGFRATAD